MIGRFKFLAGKARLSRRGSAKGGSIRVSRTVRRVVEAGHDDADSSEQLNAEATGRLDDGDIYGAVLIQRSAGLAAGCS